MIMCIGLLMIGGCTGALLTALFLAAGYNDNRRIDIEQFTAAEDAQVWEQQPH